MKQYLIPRRYKYKRQQKQIYRCSGIASNNYLTSMEGFLIKSLFNKRLNPIHFESFRRVVKRFLKKNSILLNNCICDLPITEKSLGVRMGKGKGTLKGWVSNVNKGKILYIMFNNNYRASFFVLKKATKKIPGSTLIKISNISQFFIRLRLNFFF